MPIKKISRGRTPQGRGEADAKQTNKRKKNTMSTEQQIIMTRLHNILMGKDVEKNLKQFALEESPELIQEITINELDSLGPWSPGGEEQERAMAECRYAYLQSLIKERRGE